MNYAAELSLALETAKKAGQYLQQAQHSLPAVETKADRSPVTEIDRVSESIIQNSLLSAYKNDGFLGEESGDLAGTSGRRWIVDPLDGTRPYLRAIPTWSVLIALEQEGKPVVGVMHLPGLDITCWASRGAGAFQNNRAIHVSSSRSLSTAMGSALGFVEKADEPAGKQLLGLMRAWDYTYGFMDAYSYVCVANGSLDITVNLLDKPWDCASAACIVSEAGGIFSTIDGSETVHGGSIIFSTTALQQEALPFFSKEAH
jgi:histidinol-phosphatase